jgi:hypothetical protein
MRSQREQWFYDRIGRRVFRTGTHCDCGVCSQVYENGLIITDELHAGYLFMIESECDGVKYFDTKKEVIEYELNLKK